MSVAYHPHPGSRAHPPDPATFHGYIDTAEDAMLVVEATRLGVLQRIKRRPQHRENQYLRSGAVFVYDEEEAGMKRWTDKLMWSPSRQVGHFFVYRQMTVKVPRGTRMKDIAEMVVSPNSSWQAQDSAMMAEEKKYVGSLTSSPMYPREGLIKKTLALGTVHVVSYFTMDDAMYGRLSTPSQSAEIAAIAIPPGFRSLLPAAASTSRSTNSGQDFDDISPLSSSRPESQRSMTSPQPFSPEPFSPSYQPDTLSQYRGRAYSLPDLQVPEYASTSPPFRPSTSYNPSAPGPSSYPAPPSPLRLVPIPQSLQDLHSGRSYDPAYDPYAAPQYSEQSIRHSRAQTGPERRLMHPLPAPIQTAYNPSQQGAYASSIYHQGPSSAPLYNPAPFGAAPMSMAERGGPYYQDRYAAPPTSAYNAPQHSNQHFAWSSPTQGLYDLPSPGPISPASLGTSPPHGWPQSTQYQQQWHQQQQQLREQQWDHSERHG